jgi:hypothetical protein
VDSEEGLRLLSILSVEDDSALDRIGLLTSCVCALHCAAMPFVIALLPLFGLSILADPRTEWAFVAISLVVGLSSLLPSYFGRHRRTKPLVLFGTGLAMILIARTSFEDRLSAEIPFVIFGALLIAGSHFFNRNLCRSLSGLS